MSWGGTEQYTAHSAAPFSSFLTVYHTIPLPPSLSATPYTNEAVKAHWGSNRDGLKGPASGHFSLIPVFSHGGVKKRPWCEVQGIWGIQLGSSVGQLSSYVHISNS